MLCSSIVFFVFCFFTAESDSIVLRRYHNLLIHLAVDGHVSPFPSALLEISCSLG